MRRSPRRPLILKRRKLPFHSHEPAAAPSAARCVRIMDHPTMPGTQVVLIPKSADLQSVIGALSAKGKERGPQGPNRFILLSGAGSADAAADRKPLAEIKTLKSELERRPLNDSLTNIQWLEDMKSDCLGSSDKENHGAGRPAAQPPGDCDNAKPPAKDPHPGRPPYSYMAMIQFAINSNKRRKMTLKEIYTWIEGNFPYFRHVAKPGWKNSIRHNLSLHDMFTRETTQDGKVSYWTIRPEVNRCLTLDQVYKQRRRAAAEPQRTCAAGSERTTKRPLLPRTDPYLVPLATPLFLPSSAPQQPGVGKKVRIAPKVAQAPPPTADVKAEPDCVPISVTPAVPPPCGRTSGSRRKQRLALPSTKEPVLFFPNSTFSDSDAASDVSGTEPVKHKPDSPGKDYSFKTPVKGGHLASSTPSKPGSWGGTPLTKGGRDVPDFSPIHTPSGPSVTPSREYASYSFTSTPFKELPLFGSPRDLLVGCGTPARRSLTEGLVLDTTNDSLSKILVDVSFSGMDYEDLGTGNLSQFIPDLL
ncbi:forkhead box protein M1 isoform X2 [Denticeps clupeoides]|uniref:forkhead box protein M1 isoform X2 n=1 Tax=Denticeps clupeoides TaxID=299321 RepID=UPI0010A4CEF5|nr:forkhead box protein M1 isoform X2 [Denticeps clupeoides]